MRKAQRGTRQQVRSRADAGNHKVPAARRLVDTLLALSTITSPAGQQGLLAPGLSSPRAAAGG